MGYLAACLLPVLYNLTPNPIVLRWYWLHPHIPLPAKIKQKAEKVDNLLVFAAQSIFAVALFGIMRLSPSAFREIGLTTHAGGSAIVFGSLAGLIWIGFYIVVLAIFRPSRQDLARNRAAQLGIAYWLIWSLSSASIEEIWRAFCLARLTEHGNVVAVVVTTVAFALGHPRPVGRFLSMALFGVYMAYVFLLTESVWVTMFAHLTLNIGVFFLIRYKIRSVPAE